MSFDRLKRRRTWLAVTGSIVVLLVIVVAAASWYYSGEIHSGAFVVERDEKEYQLVVTAVGDGQITLEVAEGSPDLDQPGVLGLEWEGGYGRIGAVQSQTSDSVTRPYEVITGEPTVGTRVRFDRDAFPDDPGDAIGVEYSEVNIPGPLGELPAWQIPGDGDTWLIVVHGRSASRSEGWRFVAAAADWDLPTLVISYRNDEGVTGDPSGEYNYGITEWADLDAAARYAVEAGANRLILVGLSMGGGVVAHYMDEVEDTGRVVGLVLDAPLLNLSSALFLAGQQRGVPAPITFLAARLSTLRYGVDWGELDTRDVLEDTSVPILLFHGTEDATIPASQSRNFARDAGSRVSYVEFPDAVHVGAWNVAAAGYERVLDGWLVTVLGE